MTTAKNHANYDRDHWIKRSNDVNRLDHVRLLAVAIDVSVIRENSRCAIKLANQHGLVRKATELPLALHRPELLKKVLHADAP